MNTSPPKTASCDLVSLRVCAFPIPRDPPSLRSASGSVALPYSIIPKETIKVRAIFSSSLLQTER
jgi:hypothetical protein